MLRRVFVLFFHTANHAAKCSCRILSGHQSSFHSGPQRLCSIVPGMSTRYTISLPAIGSRKGLCLLGHRCTVDKLASRTKAGFKPASLRLKGGFGRGGRELSRQSELIVAFGDMLVHFEPSAGKKRKMAFPNSLHKSITLSLSLCLSVSLSLSLSSAKQIIGTVKKSY